MTEQTLTDWCNWLRNDLLYRAPETWHEVVPGWLDSTEQRFGERTETKVPPVPDRDRHFANPPTGGLHLDCDQLASLKVLLDHAVPRETGGPMDWEGAGRRYHESILGYRNPCTCPQPRLEGQPSAPGCPVHDPSGASPVLPSGGQP